MAGLRNIRRMIQAAGRAGGLPRGQVALTTIYHDDGCPALQTRVLPDYRCRPRYKFERVS